MRAIQNTEYRFRTLPKKSISLSIAHKGLYASLTSGESSLAVVGLGYVGLPLALELARDFQVTGFDLNAERIEQMKAGNDPSAQLDPKDFQNRNIQFNTDSAALSEARLYIVAVPTPVDQSNEPDMTALRSATRSVAEHLKPGDYVVYESTVYPGCTEEVCQPILEEVSGLRCGIDFKIGYSPERINPGDQSNTLTQITKVVAGCDDEASQEIAKVYRHIIRAGVHMASSIKVAEASKIVENTQRDVNIALMNELSLLFNKLDIPTTEVLEAAGTKWNFLPFHPGLVGGHCIGVDPYYLLHKARQVEVDMDVVKSSRMMNDWLPYQLAHRITEMLGRNGKSLSKCKILIKGVTFKPDVNDVRNSKVLDLQEALTLRGAVVDIEDQHADSDELKRLYGAHVIEEPSNDYDLVVLAVAHSGTSSRCSEHTKNIRSGEPLILFDIAGHCNHHKGSEIIYEAL